MLWIDPKPQKSFCLGGTIKSKNYPDLYPNNYEEVIDIIDGDGKN